MIEGRTVNLRRLKIGHLPNLFRWRQDAELVRYYDQLPVILPMELEQGLRTNLSSGDCLNVVIETKKGEPIGMAYLKKIRWRDRNAEPHKFRDLK